MICCRPPTDSREAYSHLFSSSSLFGRIELPIRERTLELASRSALTERRTNRRCWLYFG